MTRRVIDERDSLRRTVARQDKELAELRRAVANLKGNVSMAIDAEQRLALKLEHAHAENRDLRQTIARLRDERAQEVQQAVMRARKDWARQASEEVKREWQAEVLEDAANYLQHGEGKESVNPPVSLRGLAIRLRRQSEEVSHE